MLVQLEGGKEVQDSPVLSELVSLFGVGRRDPDKK